MENEFLVKKWLSNELSGAEMKSFKALEDAALYENIVEEAKHFKGEQRAKVLPFEEFDNLLIEKEDTSININRNNKTNWVAVLTKIAAIFVIGIAVFTYLNKNSLSSFETSYAQNEKITLPDNSTVNLNQLSKIEYSESTWDEKRTLNLNGEAYFDVEKGKRFDVVTEFGKVSVLGTEFNVLSKDGMFKVSCYEGLVQVEYNDELVKVPAGTEFKLQSGTADKTNIAIAEPQWLKEMSVFENANLKDVLLEMEKQYNVKIDYQTNDKVYFTGAFEHNNLENALKSVTQALHLTYSIQDKEVIVTHAEN